MIDVALRDCKYYRIVELDSTDVIPGQGNASELRMGEKESLGEENYFSWDEEFRKKSIITPFLPLLTCLVLTRFVPALFALILLHFWYQVLFFIPPHMMF